MHYFKTFITLLLTFIVTTASAETLHGIATYVYDGDTLMMQAANQHYRIRLSNKDAPIIESAKASDPLAHPIPPWVWHKKTDEE